MSVSSILAFVIAGVAAKVKSVQVARRSEDRIAELEGERDRQYEANAGLIARIAELEGDVHRANVQFRRDQGLIDMWRERALSIPAAVRPEWQRPAGPPAGFGQLQPAGPDFRPPQIALQQAALQMQAQAQQVQLAQYQGLQNYQAAQNAMVYGNSLLGAQSLVDAELWCNCVPARHDMFLRGE
jgi:hypothetical protein